MKIATLKKDKRALSEIIGYVLLIVIALSLAAGVYVWLRGYLPSQNEKPTCPEDASIYINDYSCNTVAKTISLTIENKGLFNVDGFLITASDSVNKLPAIKLSTTDSVASLPGTYYQGLTSNEEIVANFSYEGLNNLSRLRIQPFTISNRELFLCQNIADITLDNC